VEMQLWGTAIIQVVAAGPAHNRLGAFIEEGHKIWDWRIREEAGRLYRHNGNTVEVMRHVQRGQYGSPWQSRSGQMRGDYATVKELRPGVWKVCSVASLPFRLVPPMIILDVLRGWGHTWLWNEMKVVGGTDWLPQAITGGTLIAVTDGSYIREHYPEICSAAFILECKHSGGRVTRAFPEALIEANAF
jgi:hypothetical protein